MGLLKLPKMPELKRVKISGFVGDNSIDFNEIKYKDKQKEISRQKKLEVFRETGNWPGMKQKPAVSKAWSHKQAAKDKRLDRKRKKELKQKSGEADNIDDKNDVDDLEDDFRLLKKMKKGKHYVETDKAENALDYLKSNVVGSQAPAMETRIEELEKENNALRYRNKVLEEKNQSL